MHSGLYRKFTFYGTVYTITSTHISIMDDKRFGSSQFGCSFLGL